MSWEGGGVGKGINSTCSDRGKGENYYETKGGGCKGELCQGKIGRVLVREKRCVKGKMDEQGKRIIRERDGVRGKYL
jgi:hypothetical protein